MEPLILLLLPLVPLVAALTLIFIPKQRIELFRKITLAATSISFAGTVFLFVRFPLGPAGYHFIFRVDWIPALGISYQTGVDGIGLTLTLLHALVSTSGAFISLWI